MHEYMLTTEGFVVQSFGAVADFNNRDTGILLDLFLFDMMLPDGSGVDLCR
jgi:DNA-binding response OmpR family regulator